MNDPFADFFATPDAALAFAQGAVRRALEVNGVTARTGSADTFYTIGIDGRDVLQAELNHSTGTLTWRDGSSTRQQDKLIKAHASLFWSRK